MLLLSLTSCIENTFDAKHRTEQGQTLTLRSILTRSDINTSPEDSLASMSRVQSDINHLMMGRIVMIDSVYVLSLKKEDAEFLGVSEEIYNKYQEYVEQLNSDRKLQ